ncbi:MAG: HAMP domain-containing histidine kinase [Oscillospiraceae bacterium]|nr:HAMP domain-containing histidine kinase [Oscillospiraceae bacterium]
MKNQKNQNEVKKSKQQIDYDEFQEFHEYASLNIIAVIFVFAIMLSANILAWFCLFFMDKLDMLVRIKHSVAFLQSVMFMASVVLGTVIAYFASKKFLRPINNMIKATKIIAKGNFNVRLPGTSNVGVIRELIESFNKMAEELGGIEIFRNDFINNFSHEFKTPIVSIKGFARQLKQNSLFNNLTDEQRREYIDIIIKECERLSDMSTKVLLLTKLENQQIITGKKDYSLDEQIRNCILLLEKQWNKKNINFNVELAPVVFRGNEEMLSHVWLNLLDNAIKYSSEGGEISVGSREARKMNPAGSIENVTEVKITDNGIGMDEKTLKHIFEKFYQGDAARSDSGNGLGLPLVKRIVSLCGGRISVQSEPEKGTSFYIYLPVK